MVFDMENIIEKLNETELELLIKVCEDYVNNMGSLSDEVIEELSEVDSENLIDIVSDGETLKTIIANFVENGIIEVIDENGEPFTSDEVLELLEGIPDSE